MASSSSSSSSSSSRMSVMDRDLCLLLVEMSSEKVTVRQKAFNKMSTILNNREDDFLDYMASDAFETQWCAVLDAAYHGIQKQSYAITTQVQSKNHDYVVVLHKLVELAMDRDAPQLPHSQLIGCFVRAINDQAMRDSFGVCFLHVLNKFVLCSKWCLTPVSYEHWKEILDCCLVMLDTAHVPKHLAANCLSLAVVKFLANCSMQTLLADYLSRLIVHLRQAVNEKKSNVLCDLINIALYITEAIAVDCKAKIIAFLESLVPCTVKLYKEANLRKEQKVSLFRLMHLSLIMLYPGGKSHTLAKPLTRDGLQQVEDDEARRKTLREYHYILTSEMKARDQSSFFGSNEAPFADGFIDFAARLCYTVYWNEDNWKESSGEETAAKRNKQFNKLQSIMEMVGTAPNQLNLRWLYILSAVLDRYEAALTSDDYAQLLQLLCNVQPSLQSPHEHDAFYQCCSVLLAFEQKSTHRSLNTAAASGESIGELWAKMIAAAFRACTNTAARTCAKSNLLLQLLIRHRKYPNVGFLNSTVLEAFYTYAVEKTNLNVGTVLSILETVGNAECLGSVDGVLTKLLNYLYPQTRETQSKAILHAKERLSAKTLARISILCVVTTCCAMDETERHTHAGVHDTFYRERDGQLQTLEQRLRYHSLEELLALEQHKKEGIDAESPQGSARISYNINEPLFLRLCEVVSFDKHILPDGNYFLADGLACICDDLELYLEMLNILQLHAAYDEQQCTRSPLYKKVLLKFDLLNGGFERLLKNDAASTLNLIKTRNLAERLLAIFRVPYHPSVRKLLQQTEHTFIMRWAIGQISLKEGEDSQCVTVLQPDKLATEEQMQRCFLHVVAEYLQYEGPSLNEAHELLDRLELNVFSSLDLFYLFDLCRILLAQTSHEVVAVWVLRNLVDVCKNHYTNPDITEQIIDLYGALTAFVSPYEDMIRNVTIVLYSFVKQCAKHTYSTELQVKILAQVKYLLRAYPQHIRTPTHESIYNGLVPLLSSPSYRIKLEAVRNILHFMQLEWSHPDLSSVPCSFYEFQLQLYDQIQFEELLATDGGMDMNDERMNVISGCLQLLLGIFRISFMLRRRALCDFVLLVQLGSVNDDKMANTIRLMRTSSDIDFCQLLQANLDTVLELWLTKGNRLLHFPFRLAGKIATIEEFIQLFKKNISFVILCMQPERFEQFCKSIGVQQAEMVKSILPKCVSFLLPKYAKCEGMAPKYDAIASRMHKALAPIISTVDLKDYVSEIIKHLTHRLNDHVELGKLLDQDLPSCFVADLSLSKATYSTALEHLKQSVWGSQSFKYTLLSNLCFKNSSPIERTLTDVKRWLWAADEPEQKMVHLFQYTVFLDHLKEYIGQQKERAFKPYLVRDVVYFLCNLLSSFPALRLATLNSFGRFLEHVVASSDACELLSEHLHFIVSSLLEVENVDPASEISQKSLTLLRFLILQHSAAFAGAIGKLNYLPKDERFDQLRLAISRQKTIGHENVLPREEIAALIELPNLRYEDLAALKIVLTTKKKDLKLLCDELSEQSASSGANGESVLHRLVYTLLEVVRSSPFDKRSMEALRCLSEIGPIDLGTMLLKSDAEMIAYDTINNSKEAIERCAAVLLSELNELITNRNVPVANYASLICYKMLYGKTFHALAAKLPTLHPFLGTSAEEIKLFTRTTGRSLSLRPMLANERIEYSAFVQQLSAALLSFLGNTMIKKLAEQETTFVEKLVPLLVQITIKQFEESIIDSMGSFINEFFNEFAAIQNEVHNIFNDPKAIQLMLTIVECVRIHNQCFPQYKISVNYLRIAQASQFCQAHFKAILYGDLWYREEEEQGKHDAKRHPELQNIMKSCHLAIGVNDAVKSFLNPIQERMEYYRLEQNYARCLVMQDASTPWSQDTALDSAGTQNAILQTLKDSSLYGLARSLHVAPQQIDYECAWRLSDWNVLFDADGGVGPNVPKRAPAAGSSALLLQSRSFERAHYKALKCLQLRDELAVESAIVAAQRAVSELFKLTSIESTKHIYHGLCRLRMLQQIEDFGTLLQTDRLRAGPAEPVEGTGRAAAQRVHAAGNDPFPAAVHLQHGRDSCET
ncbi:serine/threonine-protein kinase ATM-like [Anopheles merus]|uniref:serine/threonine-protein kinase ATM-like n=1 Tax=Anopheles merus TaxID=30066 RepID=UPI001BE4B7C3|nr:serine/threonine-protein kinase ATM-like [Anopheles merus]